VDNVGDDTTEMELNGSVAEGPSKAQADFDVESGVNDALNNFEALENVDDGE
jgi:hypothetical protein